MKFDEETFSLVRNQRFVFKIYNKLYGSYVCDEMLRVLRFDTYIDAKNYCNAHNLNRDIYEIV